MRKERRIRVTTTTTAIGGTGRATAGPPKEVRKEAKLTRLRKIKEKDMALSVTNAGATGTSPATAPTRRLWAKEALKEEAKEGNQATKEVKEVRQERREDTKVTKGGGTKTVKEGGGPEAKVIRVDRAVTREVQEEARKERREVTEEDLSLTARGHVTGAARRVTSGKTARSRPMKLTAAQGGPAPSLGPAAARLLRRYATGRRRRGHEEGG